MKRSTWQVLLVVLVACAALAVSTGEARAWGWGCCAPVYSCYTPCWSSCYTPCCDGVWYLGWRPGPIRRAIFGPYRWYYGGYGCFSYGYCGAAWVGSRCGVCYCDPCCCDGATVTTTAPQQSTPAPTPAVKQSMEPAEQGMGGAGAGGGTTPATPADSTAPTDTTMPGTPGVHTVPGGPTDTTPAMPTEPPSTIPGLRLDGGLLPTPGSSAVPTPQTSGLLTIWLPYEARVTINGNPTRSTGSKRQYVSYGLQPGYSYTYEIVATLERDGQTLTESRSITLTAGQQNTVVFSFNVAGAEGLAAR